MKTAKPRWWQSHLFWEAATGYLFAAPAIIYFLIFQVSAMLMSLLLSMTKFNIRTAPVWVGLDNYRNLLFDRLRYPFFWHSMWVSIKWVIMEQPLVIVIPLLVALLLNTNVRGQSIFRTLYFIPVITPGVAMAAMWVWIYDANFGLLNMVLRTKTAWLKTVSTALPSLVATSVWGAIGGTVFIWLSALKAIPGEVYEAAAIDGATGWRQFWSITLPLLRPTLFYMTVTGVIGSFQVYVPMQLMTGGDPDNSTLTYMLYLVRHAFRYNEMGTATAMSYILLVIILIATLLQFRYMRQRND
ncbi:MAG TPA: sugar ABC transporter permease [Symbiobacteriaceae bacterium]|jgi:multiple sugar transport system permease protein